MKRHGSSLRRRTNSYPLLLLTDRAIELSASVTGAEICDGQDNDCDWAIDEGQVCAAPPVACPLQSIRVVLAEVRDCTAYVNLSADTSRLPDDFQMRIERQHPTHYDSPMILSAGSFSSGSFSFNESMNKGITPRYFMSWSACTDSAKYISPVKGEQAFGTNPCL